ncbi:hypothetical protein CcaCcLH18_03646 [Colletotrichum camelliae]|nr:hypothetical protein CcaCcLH18_03646 [Colletotrichum camelliae]
MTEKDAAQQRAVFTRKLSPHSMPGDRGSSRGSYETGESSATGSLLNDTTLLPSPDESSGRRPTSNSSAPRDAEFTTGYAARDVKKQRAPRHRSNGGFLLQDAIRNDDDSDGDQGVRRRHSRNPPTSRRAKESGRASDRSGSGAGRDAGLTFTEMDTSPRRNGDISPTQQTHNLTVRKRDAVNGRPVSGASYTPPSTSHSLDIDSTQIVNMALNLSESRRQASRRIASQAVPTLAQLPDATGPNLKNHYQQQRRISRTRSPGPDKALTPRLPSSGVLHSPLQASFDMSREGTFRNHFTPSTLARAQKAKEHLELMAQYRRLLELVPPIQPHNSSRPTTASPPTSSGGIAKTPTYGSSDGSLRLGRQYNPLQYIRNRKVRARERKAIDGEVQGFGDTIKVDNWIDDVAKWAATGQTNADGCTLPPFPDADARENALQLAANANKPRRPRLDWFVDPADLLADAYWLEQDHHKQLIEDRQWRKIFPQMPDLHRPLSRQNAEYGSESGHTPGRKEHEDADPAIDPKTGHPRLAKSDTDHSHASSTRDRARQKLHDLTGHHHHRHSQSTHSHHDYLRLGKSSFSDGSDSENEKIKKIERRNRTGTLTSSHQDILEKQMLEMIAREARENDPKRTDDSGWMTPERDAGALSQPQSRQHSRKPSIVEVSESDERKSKDKPRKTPSYLQRPGRPSLEIPHPARRSSFDVDSSQPNSPDGAVRGDPFIPALGGDLSPGSSRANSPTRNPFSKVKQAIFRDRSKERGSERISEERSSAEYLASAPKTPFEASPESSGERRSVDRRGSSRSPSRKIAQRTTGDSHKSHRSVASIKLRSDDPGVRGIFKAARIDKVISGGVSKLGDLIWRKESDAADGPSEAEGTTTDESDTEPRGRRRGETPLSRTASIRQQNNKNFLDIMPTFQSEKLRATESEPAVPLDPTSRPPSRRSPRFDRLKPPRIDILSASPSSSPSSAKRLSDLSEGEPRSGASEGVKEADKRLNSILTMPQALSPDAQPPSQRSRHWSISDHSPAPDRAPMSKREIARLRALVLSSGIKAMEITRRANEPRPIFANQRRPSQHDLQVANVFWPEVAKLSTDPSIRNKAVPQTELYQFAAKTLGTSIQCSGQEWQKSADTSVSETVPALHRRVEDVRRRVATDLSAMTRAAADEADETSRDLTLGQRLKIKHTLDVIEKMLRRRRRRFRWVRRAMWLAVEWVLVGFMWYVWFVVMILRVFWGVGQGVVGAVRWLLWL